ncbi:hypothetical protein P168DRAFT_167790 [Aspergillus campestris IBT 28561]|uniref:Uncharacterized protein n=1 Tax=Aspergillus campestris (strain IBT 28561) TaxID=1392248 RepID=A0A2I1D1E7_ASPC2|nr:uncharacterized protein P168DRAFT_167790 [Aspergillus campestris IBT 28561]PKY03704.1 hypothetical protein P168DRAFT_167790 [Aspergillus campestris IBT 28561]
MEGGEFRIERVHCYVDWTLTLSHTVDSFQHQVHNITMNFFLLMFLVFFAPLLLFVGEYCTIYMARVVVRNRIGSLTTRRVACCFVLFRRSSSLPTTRILIET